jgi:hypothetical protein
MALHIDQYKHNQTAKSIYIISGIYALLLSLIAIAIVFVSYRIFGKESLYSIIPMAVVLLFMATKIVVQAKQLHQLFINLALTGLILMFGTWYCISPLVESSSAKVYDDIIEQAWLLSDKNKKSLVVFGGVDNKQKKISLWVYAQLKFDRVEYRDFYNSLNAVLDKQPAIMIIGTDYIDKMKEAYRARGLIFDPIKVEHRSTDDNLKQHNYWIFKNARSINKTDIRE